MKNFPIIISCLAVFLAAQFFLTSNACATIFDVNSTADTNTGSGTSGTLRWCINQANLSAGPHTINFSVAATITITSSLPALLQSIVIDGSTAPGFAGLPVIILDGNGYGNGDGLTIQHSDCKLFALEIANFPYRGIYINGDNADHFQIGDAGKGNVIRNNNYYGISIYQADDGKIMHNKVGTDASGNNCAGNGYDGIDVQSDAHNDSILFNQISCNNYNGIQIGGSSYNVIRGNVIGPLNGSCSGNLYRGIDIEDGSNNNIVGGSNPADFNKIAVNLYWGIEVKNNSANNLLSGNSYSCNDYGAIALNYGGNNNMASPIITTANATTVSGTSSANAVIEIFKSQNTNPILCSSTPLNQGTDFLGTTIADASGNWTMNGTFGGYLTATARDANNNTSAFSSNFNSGITDTLINDCTGYIIQVSAAFNTGAPYLCEKHCIDFTDQSQNAISWQWYFDGGTPASSTDQNPANICYNNPGIFEVKQVVYAVNGDSSVAVQNLTVYPTPPIPAFIQQGDSLICTSASYSYQWYFNDSIIAGATNQSYTPITSGYYYVEVIDSFGCNSISPTVYIDLTGISSSINTNPSVSITGSPMNNSFQLCIRSMQGSNFSLSVFNVGGRKCYEVSFPADQEIFNKEVCMPKVPAGMYLVEATSDQYRSIAKVVLE
ncbi:MAG TPA: hypothetical protein VE978_14345 [Chitinophagales bacterium]|nr:hypothetical protein [Chitinophagales bacterium]